MVFKNGAHRLIITKVQKESIFQGSNPKCSLDKTKQHQVISATVAATELILNKIQNVQS